MGRMDNFDDSKFDDWDKELDSKLNSYNSDFKRNTDYEFDYKPEQTAASLNEEVATNEEFSNRTNIEEKPLDEDEDEIDEDFDDEAELDDEAGEVVNLVEEDSENVTPAHMPKSEDGLTENEFDTEEKTAKISENSENSADFSINSQENQNLLNTSVEEIGVEIDKISTENDESNETESAAKNVAESNNATSQEPPKIENSLSHLDMSKLDKKSREILDETDENDYTFKLQDFEGPLDLLVHLIKITKIDIRDIFVSNITEQYMEMMKEIDTIDVEKASEFINMAATLLELKSKHLLPKPEEFDDAEDTSEEDFYRMVEEYKLIKDEMEKLAEIENVNTFYKAPDSTVGNFRYELPETLSVDAMVKAFTSLMQRVSIKAEAVAEKKIEKDRFTVSQKIAQIKDVLILQDRFMFTDLFEDDYSKSEIINTFLALLELLKRQYIFVEQVGLFEDITIIRNDNVEARLTEENVGSEYDEEDDGEK